MTSLVILSIRSRAANPLSIAGCLLSSAVLTATNLRLIISSWFFYFLALVFLGGVIVVVLFITSVCSNKKILYRNPLTWTLVLVFFFLILLEPECSRFLIKFNSFSGTEILSLYQLESGNFLTMLILALIICILRVISISKLDKGPLAEAVDRKSVV